MNNVKENSLMSIYLLYKKVKIWNVTHEYIQNVTKLLGHTSKNIYISKNVNADLYEKLFINF